MFSDLEFDEEAGDPSCSRLNNQSRVDAFTLFVKQVDDLLCLILLCSLSTNGVPDNLQDSSPRLSRDSINKGLEMLFIHLLDWYEPVPNCIDGFIHLTKFARLENATFYLHHQFTSRNIRRRLWARIKTAFDHVVKHAVNSKHLLFLILSKIQMKLL